MRRHGEATDDVVLRAMIPVSVRADVERGALGNRVAAMWAPLPVGIEDPVQRLRTISEGMQVLIPPDAASREGARPGWEGGFYAHMRRVLATDYGGGLYKRRQSMIEPVFAHMKFNRGILRFMRRGRPAVRSEWRLITATNNLLKLHKHRIAALPA